MRDELKDVTLLLDLPAGLLRVVWMFFKARDHVINGKKKINILLMFSYLCVTEFLRFHVYGNVIKRIKRGQCVFGCVFCFFQIT